MNIKSLSLEIVLLMWLHLIFLKVFSLYLLLLLSKCVVVDTWIVKLFIDYPDLLLNLESCILESVEILSYLRPPIHCGLRESS